MEAEIEMPKWAVELISKAIGASMRNYTISHEEDYSRIEFAGPNGERVILKVEK